MNATVTCDVSTGLSTIHVLLDKQFGELKGPMLESILIETKEAVVKHLVDKILETKIHALWERISMDTIARMAEISCGRQAIERAIK